jgi:hypothetical protein
MRRFLFAAHRRRTESSARKHGIADEDIEHAVTKQWRRIDDNSRLYLGPARNATLLEVLTIPTVAGPELAIHAMRMRPKYRYPLPER